MLPGIDQGEQWNDEQGNPRIQSVFETLQRRDGMMAGHLHRLNRGEVILIEQDGMPATAVGTIDLVRKIAHFLQKGGGVIFSLCRNEQRDDHPDDSGMLLSLLQSLGKKLNEPFP